MLEVLRFLRDNGYKTYIVTGGGQDSVRVYAQRVYGIPPEQVVGTAGGTKYGYGKDGKPFLTKDPKPILNDNNAGKPEGIGGTCFRSSSNIDSVRCLSRGLYPCHLECSVGFACQNLHSRVRLSRSNAAGNASDLYSCCSCSYVARRNKATAQRISNVPR